MQSNDQNSSPAELGPALNDLGPLAWVLDELRKSLDGSSKALKRFVREAELARGSDLAALDGSQLRIARQQLHQAVGALEMVGLGAPALVLRSMEAAVQMFIQRPEQCNEAAAAKVELAGFALSEYLEGVLADKPISALSLFPQYREVQGLVGADRIHPADLWMFDWRWIDAALAAGAEAMAYGAAARQQMDQLVLKIMRTGDRQAAQSFRDMCLGFAQSEEAGEPRMFWKIAAGYFEALAHGLLTVDLYVKRAASRILLQYAAFERGSRDASDRLAQDLLFFCSQAVAQHASDAPALSAVRAGYGLARFKPVDYESVQFGRFDPALLAQARKRIVSAKETWSSVTAGDANKFKTLTDQFSLVTDSLVKLHPPSAPLARTLTQVVDATVRSGQAPRLELALEVATAVLYLEAAFDDLDPSDPELAARTSRLAERIEGARTGGDAQPLESWMEELYRRVNDKQTMGSVVGELRSSLSELEKSLDDFFRDPLDKTSLASVPGQLSQMRGVLSVLGLDQASHAVMRMRERVEQMLETEVDEKMARAAGTFDQLGNNLGALSFLIDMLNYQPALAKRLFVYDEHKGELKPLMGRANTVAERATSVTVNKGLAQQMSSVVDDAQAGASADSVSGKLDFLAADAALADQPGLAQTARDAALAIAGKNKLNKPGELSEFVAVAKHQVVVSSADQESEDFEEEDLRDIFLEEAREVTAQAQAALTVLAHEPADVGELTILRRAFHTLKGSSRMVGLDEFGEAAWSMEQMLNGWLAEQKPSNSDFQNLCTQAMDGFSAWIADIAADSDAPWQSAAFRHSADAMRLDGRFSPLILPAAGKQRAAPQDGGIGTDSGFDLAPAPAVSSPDFDFTLDFPAAPVAAVSTAPAALSEPNQADGLGIDFDSLSALTGPVSVAPVAEKPPADNDFELDFDESEFAAESQPVELSADDFDAHFRTPAVTSKPAELVPSAVPQPDVFDFALQSGNVTPLAAFEEKAESTMQESVEDEQVKVIGSLRIGIPLYNVYLNEADEWSRRLVTEITEWTIEAEQPIGDSPVVLAHSLSGSSATVGFDALSGMARALEYALRQSQLRHGHKNRQSGKLFLDAAEDIRRLLHQFAAGFLKPADPEIIQALRDIDFADSVGETFSAVDNNSAAPAESVAAAAAESPEAFAPVMPESISPPVLPEAVAVPVAQAVVPPKAAAVMAASMVWPAAAPVSAAPFVTPRATAETAFSEDVDDEIDAVDVIDPDLFPIFEEEGAELMPQLGGALRQWAAQPDDRQARNEVLRILHTLKGSARLAGAMRLGEMAHRVESDIESVGTDQAATQDFDPLLSAVDAMQANFESLRHPDDAPVAPEPQRPAQTASQTHAATPIETDTTAAISDKPALSAVSQADVSPPATASGARNVMLSAAQTTALQPLRAVASGSIRVRSHLLDRMVNQAGEVMITRSRLEAELGQLRGSLNDLSGNLNRLRTQLRDVELHTETQMQSRLQQAKEAQLGFDPLEFDRFTRVQELTRMMAESVNDVATVQRTLQRTVEATEDDLIAQARQTRELQRDLLRTRMVEFEGISERLYRVVRQASKDAGKQVKLDLQGGTIEMDRGMLDRMTPAFEHLLRNCVAHGIEEPQVRIDAGKEAGGLITVRLQQSGNDVSVEFSDDGAGLNLQRIREKAFASGLVQPGQQMNDDEAANLIFMPGFTTAAQVTELAGRGIGMDVVRSEINALGGRIETSTLAGKGTTFKMILPLTTAVTQVVMMRAGSSSVGVPSNLVETVRRIPAKELQQAYNSGVFDVAGGSIPFFWSGALLQTSPRSTEPQGKTATVTIFQSAAQRIAMHVDEVLGNQEVVVKNLGPQLSRLPGLAGMSILASGAVALIYNPVALASVYGQQARAWGTDSAEPHMLEQGNLAAGGDLAKASAKPAASQIPLILVVDDSITVRRVTQRLLQREGYRVSMAADGLQALERLQEERPTVVLSDIEMPRMDGFDLARNIRGDARLSDLPIIMITSRIAEKHREHAMELGVDHYLGKPYAEDELLSLIRHYASAVIPA